MESKHKLTSDVHPYKQKYKIQWESELKWLRRGNDDFHAICTLCKTNLNVGKGGIKDLRRHESTDCHKRNTASGSSSMLNFVTKQNNSSVDAELWWANFVCENNLSIKLADNFSQLVPKMFPDSEIAKNFHCGRTKTGQIIKQAIGAIAEEDIVNTMRETLFTLLIDESTDISVTRQMVIMARFFGTDKVETRLYKIVAFSGKATGENLFNVVDKSFEDDNIPWHNCLSMSSDGAKAMVGEFNSVLSRVRGQQENLWFLHCTCHVAHLAASHACSELPNVCEQLSRDVYTYFKTSGKRQDDFQSIQKALDVEEHKILRPCSTRWLATLQCVERLLEQWPALLHYFDSLDSKQCTQESVQRIKQTLHSPSAKLYFLFLSAVLPRFTKFNLLFQQDQPYVLKLYSEACILLRQFIASFVQFQIIQKAADITSVDIHRENQLSDAAIFVGHATHTFLENHEISSQERSDFFSNVRKFYEMGTKELYRLLPLQDVVLKNIDILDATKKGSGDWEKVASLAARFPNVIPSGEFDKLNEEFLAYTMWEPPSSLGLANSDAPDAYWQKVSSHENNGTPCFPTLCKLAKAMLILPHSNAAVERAFSNLKLIKTAHRSSLESPMLNALMHISARKKTDQFQPTNEMRKRARNLIK